VHGRGSRLAIAECSSDFRPARTLQDQDQRQRQEEHGARPPAAIFQARPLRRGAPRRTAARAVSRRRGTPGARLPAGGGSDRGTAPRGRSAARPWHRRRTAGSHSARGANPGSLGAGAGVQQRRGQLRGRCRTGSRGFSAVGALDHSAQPPAPQPTSAAEAITRPSEKDVGGPARRWPPRSPARAPCTPAFPGDVHPARTSTFPTAPRQRPEISQVDGARPGEKDVVRRDVPMHDLKRLGRRDRRRCAPRAGACADLARRYGRPATRAAGRFCRRASFIRFRREGPVHEFEHEHRPVLLGFRGNPGRPRCPDGGADRRCGASSASMVAMRGSPRWLGREDLDHHTPAEGRPLLRARRARTSPMPPRPSRCSRDVSCRRCVSPACTPLLDTLRRVLTVPPHRGSP